MANVKNNLRGTAIPQVTDDSSQGYSQGSQWWYGGLLWVCRSAAAGAAVWAVIGEDDAWPSGGNRYPATFNGLLGDITPSTSSDLFGLFPFVVHRPFNAVSISVSAAGSSGAAMTVGVYPHDPVTGKPSTAARLANMGNIALTSTGTKSVGSATIDYVGLLWVSVHVKLTGLTTAPTYVGMTGANGKFIYRSDGLDLSTKAPIQHYSSTDTYTVSPPTPVFTTQAINRNLPCPVIRAA